MNHQEAKDLLLLVLDETHLSLIKTEVFRLSWEGKGYNVIAEETGYDHDYVRKAGSQLWKELTATLSQSITKRNFRPIMEELFREKRDENRRIPEYPGGAMLFSSPFYIERSQAEADAYQEIQRSGGIVRIRSPRKMGKSSLMLRVIDQADSLGYRTAVVDFQQADTSILSDLDKLLRWICLQLGSQLGLKPALDDYWSELTGSKLSCSSYLHSHILAAAESPVLLVINELNLIFDYPEVSRDFLPLLRSWHEEAKHSKVMKGLRQLLIYSTEVYVQLDLNLSPFNVGLPIYLAPFSSEQVATLAQVYGFNWQADNTLNSPVTKIMSSLGGHPYLVQLVLYELATRETLIDAPSEVVEQLLASAGDVGGLLSGFLQQLLASIIDNESASLVFKQVIKNPQGIEKKHQFDLYQLERLGVVRLERGVARPACRLFTDYLVQHLR